MDNLRPTQMDSPLNRRVRAFLGIGPPPEEWLDALEEWRSPFKGNRLTKSISWTHPKNLHMTLRFFGAVKVEDILKIQERLNVVTGAFSPLRLSVSNILLFPDAQHPRILALDAFDETHQIDQIAGEIRSKLREFGQPPDERPFRPHLTLARLHGGILDSAIVRTIWTEDAGPDLPLWEARELTLYESKLQPGGSVYTPLAVFPLTRKDS